MAEAKKVCPKCREKVNLLASVCKHCTYEFTPSELAASQKLHKQSNGCAIVAVIAVLVGLLAMCSADGDEGSSSEKSAAVSAEERRKGFHCLSGWDGSNRSLVNQVKAKLRDPESFEHAETKIAPIISGGTQHAASMTYRARNGFGGMNVSTAIASIDPASCEATTIMTGE